MNLYHVLQCITALGICSWCHVISRDLLVVSLSTSDGSALGQQLLTAYCAIARQSQLQLMG